jgi:hypothetical protein
MDDLIVSSTDCEIGLKYLERVLDVASRSGLIINWEKCKLLQTKVEYLGCVNREWMHRTFGEQNERRKEFSGAH